MQRFRTLIRFAITVIVFYLASLSSAEIHRARSQRHVKPRRPVFDDEDLSPPGVQYPYSDHNVPSDIPYPYSGQESTIALEAVGKHGYDSSTWIYSLVSAALVGLSGIFPLLIIRIDGKNSASTKKDDDGHEAEEGELGGGRLRLLLSFAVGGLLGDVFLHLLPETWQHVRTVDDYISCGLWVIAGLLSFLFIEKLFPDSPEGESDAMTNDTAVTHSKDNKSDEHSTYTNANQIDKKTVNNATSPGKNKNKKKNISDHISEGCRTGNGKLSNNSTKKLANGSVKSYQSNGVSTGNGRASSNGVLVRNGNCDEAHAIQQNKYENGTAGITNGKRSVDQSETPPARIKTSGWLNLLANVIDNFTHGLAVAASYSVSTKTGLLTTGAILLHEVPHEIGDFAILLRSGFDRWKAAQAQLITATGGICGAFVALCASSMQQAGNQSSWMLPFTSGGFLYIALVTVLPDLLAESKPFESLKQMALLVLGISIMSLVTFID